MGGDYQNKGNINESIAKNGKNGFKNQKLSNNEIELLLKKGILGLFDKGVQKIDQKYQIDENQIQKEFQ